MIEFRSRTLNKIKVLVKASEVIEHWGFFIEGLTALNKTAGGKMFMPEEVFLAMLMDVLHKGETYGIVALMQNKNGKNVGFFVVRDDSEKFFKPVAIVWAAYSTGNNTRITRDMIVLGEEWTRKMGYEQYYAVCLRTGSSIKKLYTKRWKFELYGLLFRKEIKR